MTKSVLASQVALYPRPCLHQFLWLKDYFLSDDCLDDKKYDLCYFLRMRSSLVQCLLSECCTDMDFLKEMCDSRRCTHLYTLQSVEDIQEEDPEFLPCYMEALFFEAMLLLKFRPHLSNIYLDYLDSAGLERLILHFSVNNPEIYRTAGMSFFSFKLWNCLHLHRTFDYEMRDHALHFESLTSEQLDQPVIIYCLNYLVQQFFLQAQYPYAFLYSHLLMKATRKRFPEHTHLRIRKHCITATSFDKDLEEQQQEKDATFAKKDYERLLQYECEEDSLRMLADQGFILSDTLLKTQGHSLLDVYKETLSHVKPFVYSFFRTQFLPSLFDNKILWLVEKSSVLSNQAQKKHSDVVAEYRAAQETEPGHQTDADAQDYIRRAMLKQLDKQAAEIFDEQLREEMTETQKTSPSLDIAYLKSAVGSLSEHQKDFYQWLKDRKQFFAYDKKHVHDSDQLERLYCSFMREFATESAEQAEFHHEQKHFEFDNKGEILSLNGRYAMAEDHILAHVGLRSISTLLLSFVYEDDFNESIAAISFIDYLFSKDQDFIANSSLDFYEFHRNLALACVRLSFQWDIKAKKDLLDEANVIEVDSYFGHYVVRQESFKARMRLHLASAMFYAQYLDIHSETFYYTKDLSSALSLLGGDYGRSLADWAYRYYPQICLFPRLNCELNVEAFNKLSTDLWENFDCCQEIKKLYQELHQPDDSSQDTLNRCLNFLFERIVFYGRRPELAALFKAYQLRQRIADTTDVIRSICKPGAAGAARASTLVRYLRPRDLEIYLNRAKKNHVPKHQRPRYIMIHLLCYRCYELKKQLASIPQQQLIIEVLNEFLLLLYNQELFNRFAALLGSSFAERSECAQHMRKKDENDQKEAVLGSEVKQVNTEFILEKPKPETATELAVVDLEEQKADDNKLPHMSFLLDQLLGKSTHVKVELETRINAETAHWGEIKENAFADYLEPKLEDVDLFSFLFSSTEEYKKYDTDKFKNFLEKDLHAFLDCSNCLRETLDRRLTTDFLHSFIKALDKEH